MASKLPISVYLLTYNEEANIRAALESVVWADEIVVVDSFSTDKTEQICREFTDLFFQYEFEGFGRLRNQAIDHTTHDWILSVDADERVSEELREEITMLVQRGPSADAFYVPRKSHFLGQWIRYGGWYPDYRQPQFFHRSRMRYREDMVHEGFEFMNGAEGKLGYLQGHVFQYPFRTISQFLQKMNRYSTLRSGEMFATNKRFHCFGLVCRPLFTLFKMLVLRRGVFDGMAGLVLAGLYSTYVFAKYAKLWELCDTAVHAKVPAPKTVVQAPLSTTCANDREWKPKISVVIIALNEQRNIRECLEAVKWVDEIVVVDGFSRDRTVEICREYSVSLYQQVWAGFGPKKNFAISRATMPWILLVDADERIPESLRSEIEAVISDGVPEHVAGFMIPRRNYFYRYHIQRLGCYPDHQLRLFRKDRAYLDDAEPHNRMILDGTYEYLKNPMDHYTVPDVASHYHKLDDFTALAAQERAKTKTSVSVSDLLLRPLWTIAKLFTVRGGLQEGVAGLIFCGFAGCYTFLKYAKLWEMRRDERRPPRERP